MTTAALEQSLIDTGQAWVSVIAMHGDDVTELTERRCVRYVPCDGQTLENEKTVRFKVRRGARSRHIAVYAHAADRQPSIIGHLVVPLRLFAGDYVEFQRGQLTLDGVAFDVLKAVADRQRREPPRRGWFSWLLRP